MNVKLNEDAYTLMPVYAESKSEDLLKQIQEDSIETLKEEIKEIEQQIQERKTLSNQVDAACEEIKTSIENVINEFRSLAASDRNGSEDGSVTSALIRLKQEQALIDKFKVEEKLNMWRDIAVLKKELRERVREFRERENNSELLDKILK